MLFSTNIFLFAFLPAVFILYFAVLLVAKRLNLGIAPQNAVLLLSSLFFYFWGSGKFILLILVSVALNYVSAMLISKARTTKVKSPTLAFCVACNLSLLFYFKYAGFFYEMLENIAALFGSPLPAIASITLPIGISFYTFQAMSYTIDVYRGDVPPQPNPAKLALYISFFPQLIAGPIVRYSTVCAEIGSRSSTLDNIYEGICRFGFGLGKKVLLADTIGSISGDILALPFNEVSPGHAWLSVAAYTLQIYFDFSAYSDMAIGLARIFGFRFDENFKLPYTSHNITEFWRRWHISLSSWFRDYLYIPLGGNRKGNVRTYLNLFIVFLLCGLWHGANYTFLLWGLYHGLLLVIERVLRNRFGFQMKGIAGRVVSLLLVMLGWVFFMSPDIDYAFSLLARMFFLTGNTANYYTLFYYLEPQVILFAVIAILASCFRFEALRDKLRSTPVKAAAAMGVFGLAVIFMSKASFTPFIYFQF